MIRYNHRRSDPDTKSPGQLLAPLRRIDAPFTADFVHRLVIGRHLLSPSESTLADMLQATDGRQARVLAFVDAGLADARDSLVDGLEQYFSHHGDRVTLVGPVAMVPGGEAAKNDRAIVEDLLQRIHDAHLCRQSYVLVIGGGAVLDVVGFAAGIAHRGIRLVRMPSTTLAQGDSGIGVKNGINAFGLKNYLGTFSPPWAVLNDIELLTTLTATDWRAGFSEAVKVALVKDAEFFGRIESEADAIRNQRLGPASAVLARSAELHLQHIVTGGDPFETTIARPLDFGHWSAHKLEQLSNFAVTHGDAVAIGVAIDTAYSALAGHVSEKDCERVMACLHSLGFDFDSVWLDQPDALLDGLEEFREHLGGRLTITLLRDLGRGFDAHAVDDHRMRAAIQWVRHHAKGEGDKTSTDRAEQGVQP